MTAVLDAANFEKVTAEDLQQARGGFLFRQVNKYKSRRIKFMKALSDNLYFKNLDNNAGVFYHLIDAAEVTKVPKV